MSKLKAKHIFSFSRILKDLGIKDEIQSYMQNFDHSKKITQEEAGLDILFTIFDKATTTDGEKSLYEFISGISEVPVEELEEMGAIEFLNLVKDIADIEEWKAFFTSVANLMKSK